MNLILEIGVAVKARRTDMGRTLTSVAKMSGLSRATVSALENGSIKDLSLARSQRLLNVLGLILAVPAVDQKPSADLPTRTPALEIAAQTASTSFKSRATAARPHR